MQSFKATDLVNLLQSCWGKSATFMAVEYWLLEEPWQVLYSRYFKELGCMSPRPGAIEHTQRSLDFSRLLSTLIGGREQKVQTQSIFQKTFD